MQLPSGLIVTISGARAISPEVLSPDAAYVLAAAFAGIMPEGAIIVSRDSRPSGHALKKAVLRALADAGREILDADLVPLPTTQLAVERLHAAGAIDITASHNPAQYNGLKFLDGHGTFITQDVVDRLLAAAKDIEPAVEGSAPEARDIQGQAVSFHLDTLRPMVADGKPFTVAVDAVNGAGSYIVPRFLEEMGCTVIPLAVSPEEPFPHTPEPTPANLVWTQEALAGKSYDLCVVVDPDADRLVVIDENGRLIAEEATIPLVVESLMLQGRRGTVVINLSTSRMSEDVAAKYGCEVVRSAVGERNVVTKMQEVGAVFGAEGGGGIIDPEVHFGRDSLVGIAHVITLMRLTGKPLSQLVDELPSYAMEKVKVPLSEGLDLQAVYAALREKYADADLNTDDGLRFSWPDRWLHVRPSNTEPIVRFIAEAPTAEEVSELVDTSFL